MNDKRVKKLPEKGKFR